MSSDGGKQKGLHGDYQCKDHMHLHVLFKADHGTASKFLANCSSPCSTTTRTNDPHSWALLRTMQFPLICSWSHAALHAGMLTLC